MPPLNAADETSDEVIEVNHHLVHLNNPSQHYPSIVEEINAFLHSSSTPTQFSNGSHVTASGSTLPSTSGQGIAEDSYHFLIVCALLIPLIITVGAIFIIALVVRKMRRSESIEEVVRQNEFGLKDYSNTKRRTLSRTVSASSSIRSEPPLHHTSSLDVSTEAVSMPSSSQVPLSPPWFLYSTSYYRSQYHLNRLYQNTSGYGTGSAPSLQHLDSYGTNGVVCSPHPPGSIESSDDDGSKKSKSTSKKFRRVLHIINFPKKIRQHQAERNRFNIYTIPHETREQLKQIYVY